MTTVSGGRKFGYYMISIKSRKIYTDNVKSLTENETPRKFMTVPESDPTQEVKKKKIKH